MSQRLASFIEQRDKFALLIPCGEIESASIIKTLQAIDDQNSTDMFWIFTGEFIAAEAWVGLVVKDFQEKHAAIRAEQQKRGQPSWSDIPSNILGDAHPPSIRLKELILFARALLPQGSDHRLVWVMFPLHIGDGSGYLDLMDALIQIELATFCFHHTRLIIREEPGLSVVSGQRQNSVLVDQYQPDLSHEAMETSLAEEAADTELPLPERLQALLVLAGTDYSKRRYTDAMEKYTLLLEYYLATENHTLSALVLNGMGEVEHASGNPQQAVRWFESALTPAIEGKAHPVLLNITLNLANLKLKLQDWPEAESYYDSAEKLATAHLMAEVKIQCLENRGHCQYMQAKNAEAAESWKTGAMLAGKLEEPQLQKPLLDRLRQDLGWTGEWQDIQEIECTPVPIGAH